MKFVKYRRYDDYRWECLKTATLVGKYDMPLLKAVTEAEPRNLVPFNEASRHGHPEDSWFHTYVDDYRFEQLWTSPKKYLPLLARFEGGLTPDFSVLLDGYMPTQIWNCWRNRVIALWMQEQGLNVVPNVSWSDEESLEWAFDGIPEYSVLSITTQGCMRKLVCMQSLINGLHELERRKHPLKIIVYGSFRDEWRDKFSVPFQVFQTFMAAKRCA